MVGPVGGDAQAAKVRMRANGTRKRVIVDLSNKTAEEYWLINTSRIRRLLLALGLQRRDCRLNLPTFRARPYIRKILRSRSAKIPDWGLGLCRKNYRLNQNRLDIHCRWRNKNR
jgi:hypothetical protein